MMAKAIDIISRALRLIGVASDGEALEASSSSDALSVLNAILAETYGNIAVPDYNAASLTAEMTIDEGDKEALSYELGSRLAPEYGQSLPPEYVMAHEKSMTRLRNRYFVQGSADFSELPIPTSYDWNDQ